VAEEKGMIDWKYGAVDGSFFPVKVAVKMSAMAIGREYCSTVLQMLWYASSSNYHLPIVTKDSKCFQCWLKSVGNGKRGNPKRRPKLLLLIKATMPDGCVSDSNFSCIRPQIKNGTEW